MSMKITVRAHPQVLQKLRRGVEASVEQKVSEVLARLAEEKDNGGCTGDSEVKPVAGSDARPRAGDSGVNS